MAETYNTMYRTGQEQKQSIDALLNNMPIMSFSKDAETGIYLACNQAFADYAHLKSPEEVVGLTDAQIFHPAIVSAEVFELVQMEIESRRQFGSRYSGRGVFASRIICADCGGFYGSKVWHSNDPIPDGHLAVQSEV